MPDNESQVRRLSESNWRDRLKDVTKTEQLYTAENLITEVYQQLNAETSQIRTVAEEDYFLELSETYARIIDDLQTLHSYILDAEI